MHKNWRVITIRILAFVLGLVFIIAALAKSLLPPGQATMFGELLYAHPWFARSLIGIEIIIGAWLISGWRRSVVVLAALLLLMVFSGVIIHDMVQHYPQPCGCFGAAWKQAHEPAVIEHGLALGLVRNALFAIATAVLFFTAPIQRQRDSGPAAAVPAGPQSFTRA